MRRTFLLSDLGENSSLDEWYAHVNGVFLDRNFYKSDAVVFTHLAEIVGGLSLLGSRKEKVGVTPSLYVPKAIAWWLTLCGKVGVKSVSDMVWWKYPGVCTYCRLEHHNDITCRQSKKRDHGPDWGALREIGLRNQEDQPKSLDDWMEMFQTIYPANRPEDFAMTFARFSEEMGELAEAIRIFPIAPGSFLSEAADVFAWLMHLQNLLRVHGMTPDDVSLGKAMANSYAKGCEDCENPVCTCPPILPTTLNRIAHEAPDSRKSFSASMMTIDEAMARFSMSSRTIRINGQTIDATPEFLKQINDGVTQLIFLAISNKEASSNQTKILLDSLYEVEKLTSAHRVTQQSLEALAQAIAELPTASRKGVLDHLEGVTEGLWAGALIELVKAAVAVKFGTSP